VVTRGSSLETVDGKEEVRLSPLPITGEDVVRWGRVREAWREDGDTPLVLDPVRQYGIKKVSGLYQLPYWMVSSCNTNYSFSLAAYR
jgi:hypothetical protein